MLFPLDILRPAAVACLAAAALFHAAPEASAAVVFRYSADDTHSADPMNYGWIEKSATQKPDGYRAGTETLPGFNGSYITFNKTSNTSQAVLVHSLALADTTNAAGWTLTLVARVPQASDSNLFGSYVRVFANGKENMFSIINDPVTGNEGVIFKSSASGSGSESSKHLPQLISLDVHSTYVTYQLYYNPSTASTSLYANGVLLQTLANSERQNDWEAVRLTIEWGRGTGTGAAESRWNEISFETGFAVIPEPGTFFLSGAGLFALVWLRRRSPLSAA